MAGSCGSGIVDQVLGGIWHEVCIDGVTVDFSTAIKKPAEAGENERLLRRKADKPAQLNRTVSDLQCVTEEMGLFPID